MDEVWLDALAQQGHPGRMTFANPEAILALETVDGQAGMSLWTRADLQRYPFLRLN